MKDKEIIELIEKNCEPEKLNLFINQILEKAKIIDKQINLTTLGIILLILVYYLGKFNLNSEVQLGPIKIYDTKILIIITPFILSFLILRFVVLSSHKAEIKKIVRLFVIKYFRYDNSKVDILYTDDLSRLLLPISIYDEIGKFNFKTKTGCFSVILMLPMFLLVLVPYIILGLWSYPNIINFTSLDFYNKVLLIGTIWLFLLSIYYFIKTLVIGFKESEIN